MRTPPCLTALLAAFPGPLVAQVINIDFDESATTSVDQGLAAAPDPSGSAALWNPVTGSGTTTINTPGLVDSDGEATGVSISLGINGSHLSEPGQQEIGGASLAYQDLMSDYVFLSSPTNTQVVTRNGTSLQADPVGRRGGWRRFAGRGNRVSEVLRPLGCHGDHPFQRLERGDRRECRQRS